MAHPHRSVLEKGAQCKEKDNVSDNKSVLEQVKSAEILMTFNAKGKLTKVEPNFSPLREYACLARFIVSSIRAEIENGVLNPQ